VLDYQHEGRVQMALDLLPNMELSEYLGRARKHLTEFGVPKTKKVPVYYGKSALETTPLYKDKVKVGKSALETAADAMNALTESTYATDDALSKFVSGSFKPPKQKVSIKELNQPVYHLDTEGFPTYAGTVSTVTFTAPATEISEDDPNLVSVSYSVNGPDQPIMAEVTMIKKTGGIEDYVSKK